MTRSETPQTISFKPKSANLCRFICIISITVIASVSYVIYNRPVDSLGDPSDQFMVKNIPKTFTRLEGVEPEDRDVFTGFQTSFLPHEDMVLTRLFETESHAVAVRDNTAYTTNGPPKRIKRRSQTVSEDDE